MNEFRMYRRRDGAEPLKAIIYCRISSVSQARKGDGLASQEQRCREYSAFKGHIVTKVVYDRAISGKLLDRPGIKEVLQFLKREKNAEQYVVVFDDISRLARDIRVHLDLRDAIFASGAQIDCPTIEFRQDFDGRYVEGMQALSAEHHRRKNAEQTRNRMRSRAMNGFWCFRAPPGFKYLETSDRGHVLVRDEPLASIIQEALEAFASGRLETQAEVKRYLESRPEFMAGRKQQELRFEEVERLLTRQHYAGYIEVPQWGVMLRKANHDGLVTLEQFERIQARLKGEARAPARKDISEDFVLRGAIACADCGKPLTACWSTSKTGKKHAYYMCFSKGCESCRKSIQRDVLEGDFQLLLQGMTPAEQVFEAFRAMFAHAWEARLSQAQKATLSLRDEITQLDRQVEHLMDRIVDATDTSMISAYERRIAKLSKEKLLAAEKLQQKPGPKRPFEEMFELACDFIASPWRIWENGNLPTRRMVLKLVFAERPAYSRKLGFRTPKTSIPFKLLESFQMKIEGMAERKGFEPLRRFPAYTLSRRAPSTTRPSLRMQRAGRARVCVSGARACRSGRNILIDVVSARHITRAGRSHRPD